MRVRKIGAPVASHDVTTTSRRGSLSRTASRRDCELTVPAISRRSLAEVECRLQTRCSQSDFVVERQLMFKADVGRFPLRVTGPLWKPTSGAILLANVRLLARRTGALDPIRAAQAPTSNGVDLTATNGIISRME